jgi:hypothetical protein
MAFFCFQNMTGYSVVPAPAVRVSEHDPHLWITYGFGPGVIVDEYLESTDYIEVPSYGNRLHDVRR